MPDQLISIRKIVTSVEEVRHDRGPVPDKPLRRGWVAVVLVNPYAGRYVDDILPMMEALKPVGLEMAERLVKALDVPATAIETYGKGAIVGADGELEHGALWHVPGGYAMRELLGGAKAIVPSSKKVGTLGCALDVPLHHIDAAYVRSHFSAIEVCVPDAPRADEILFCLAMTDGGRIHARVGGLRKEEIKGDDGLR